MKNSVDLNAETERESSNSLLLDSLDKSFGRCKFINNDDNGGGDGGGDSTKKAYKPVSKR